MAQRLTKRSINPSARIKALPGADASVGGAGGVVTEDTRLNFAKAFPSLKSDDKSTPSRTACREKFAAQGLFLEAVTRHPSRQIVPQVPNC